MRRPRPNCSPAHYRSNRLAINLDATISLVGRFLTGAPEPPDLDATPKSGHGTLGAIHEAVCVFSGGLVNSGPGHGHRLQHFRATVRVAESLCLRPAAAASYVRRAGLSTLRDRVPPHGRAGSADPAAFGRRYRPSRRLEKTPHASSSATRLSDPNRHRARLCHRVLVAAVVVVVVLLLERKR